MWKKYSYYLRNLDCPNCTHKIETELSKKDYYQSVSINFSKLQIHLESSLEEDIFTKLQKDISNVEPGVCIYEEEVEERFSNKDLIFIFLGLVLFLLSFFVKNISTLSNILVIISYIVLGYQTILKALSLLRKGVFNENFLIVISAIGAFILSKPNEGFMVLFLYEIGKYLENRASYRVRKNVSKLMGLKPTIAHRKEKSKVVDIDPVDVQVGDILVVLNGEKVPLDGKLKSKSCELDTSSLTGESKLVLLNKGEEVLSGSINEGDVFELQVTSVYENSTVKRILDLMEHASDRKAKTENFVERAARYYTPIMMFISFLIFLLTPFLFHISYTESFYRALMILVVSCPCAIAISVPLCYFAGLGALSKRGILVKGSSYIDALTKINTFVFDKTGTLTTGNFGVLDIQILNPRYSYEEVLHFLVYGEKYSNHPLAKSIINQYPEIVVPDISKVKEIKGKGISYEFEDNFIKLGNAKFVKTDLEVDGTVIYISVNESVIAYAVLGDEIKEEAMDVFRNLREKNINTIMLTGDKKEMAEKMRERLQITSYYAELLPDDKFHLFEKLKKERSSECISFVGDGINDAPVLRVSDCGIAMGSGSESAIEASDVVIMSSNLEKILEAQDVSKKTIGILKQNLLFAISIKFIVLVLSFLGIGSMWIAVFADVGVTLLTILNSLRILK